MKNILNILVIGIVLLLGITLIYKIGYSDPIKNDFHAYTAFEEKVKNSISETEIVQENEFDLRKRVSHADKTELLSMLREREQVLELVSVKQREFKPKTQKVKAIHDKLLKMIDMKLDMANESIKLVESDALTKEKVNEIRARERDVQRISMECSRDMTSLAASYGRY